MQSRDSKSSDQSMVAHVGMVADVGMVAHVRALSLRAALHLRETFASYGRCVTLRDAQPTLHVSNKLLHRTFRIPLHGRGLPAKLALENPVPPVLPHGRYNVCCAPQTKTE